MFGPVPPLDTVQRDDKASKHALPPVVWRLLDENSGFSRPKTRSDPADLYPWKQKDAPFPASSASFQRTDVESCAEVSVSPCSSGPWWEAGKQNCTFLY